MAVRPIPEGYTSVSPYLSVEDSAAAIDFYTRAFGATEIMRMEGPGGMVAHAEIRIGNGVIMMSDPMPGSQEGTVLPPKQLGGASAGIFLYVENVDAVYKQAIDAGATEVMAPTDMFWGDRFSSLLDPFGHHWSLATHVEDVPPEEMPERAAAAMAQMGAQG